MSGGKKAAVYLVILGCLGLLALFITDDVRMAIGPLAASVLPWVVVGAFLLWVISAGVQRGMQGARQDATREAVAGLGDGPPAFPVIADGPGRYRVSGVDRESKMDTSLVVRADSPENAKVKGELEGIVVTRVEFQGRA
jgi:hypothetical protein